MQQVQNILDKVKGKHIYLIGDVFLSEILYGEVERLSDDGPIPVVQKHHRSQVPGAAGYLALLLVRLGFKVTLFTVMGNDTAGNDLLRILKKQGVGTKCTVLDDEYRTTCRTQIRVEGCRYSDRDILKIDSTDPVSLSEEKYEMFYDHIEAHIDECDGVVFLDHDKSIMTRGITTAVQKLAKGKKIPFIGNSLEQLEDLKKFDAVVPHVKSVLSLLNGKENKSDQLAKRLYSHLNCKQVYMTLGSEGISVVTGEPDVLHVPGKSQLIQDNHGSDEAVLCGVTAGVMAGIEPQETAEFASLLASIALTHNGYHVFKSSDVLTAAKRLALNDTTKKHVNLEQLKKIVNKAKVEGKKVVWTNGCYDILHAGHVIYLEKAKALGDILVVGLNSDASVQKIKGVLRPVMEENERAKVLSSLGFVDYVVVFDDYSPVGMIETLKPDVYAKGGDYTLDTINQEERKLVESYNGAIALLPGVEGMSTTEMIRRILRAYGTPEQEDFTEQGLKAEKESDARK